jgi:zinc transport system substrate-binding protein
MGSVARFWIKAGLPALCAVLLTVSAGFARPLSVFVSILPQKYVVEKIGGNLVDVSVMVGPGAGPATYEPKPQQMVRLAGAKIYFAVGVPFEHVWLRKILEVNPKLYLVHTDSGVERIPMKTARKKGDRRSQVSVTKDPHIWLSPPLVMLQARNVLRGLLEVDPANRAVFEDNYRQLIREIVDLDIELGAGFAEMEKGKEFMVFHPAWGYFAKAYGLKQIAVEIEGKEPKPAELQQLIKYAKERQIEVLFVQPQFSRKSAQTIARAIGGRTAVADPLAPDWAENLRRVAGLFKAAGR